MINLLIRLFVKSDDFTNPKTREKSGYMVSIVGVVLNIFLFIIKFTLGTFVNSLAIISDGFNNLSDSFSNIITLFSYNISARKADRTHPYGYGRFEYIASLFIGFIIVFMGFELLQSSFNKILKPSPVNYNLVVLISLLFSILIKIWMAYLNSYLGKRINSTIMLATAKDYRNDVVSTLVTIIALVSSLFTDLPIDGFLSLIVSLMIFKAGFEVIRDTVTELIGKQADQEIIDSLHDLMSQYPEIIGIHDVLVHNYGPLVNIASLHAEVDSRAEFLEIHDLIDIIERKANEDLNIFLTIHMDPLVLDDPEVGKMQDMISDCLAKIDNRLSLHDFRLVKGKTHTNLIFDIETPYGFYISDSKIIEKLYQAIKNDEITYYLVVNFDRV